MTSVKIEAITTTTEDLMIRTEPNVTQKFVLKCCGTCYGSDQMIEESKEWEAVFANCGHMSTIWDMGGIRYGETGKLQSYGKCPTCGIGSRVTICREPKQAKEEIERD